jgi:hypothetical protein
MPGRNVITYIDSQLTRWQRATPAQRARMLGLSR